MNEAAAHRVQNIIPTVPVRQWVLSFPIPLRSLFAVHPELLTPVLAVIQRVITTHLIQQAGSKRTDATTGAVTLIQRFGSAANLNIHLHAHRTRVFRRRQCGWLYDIQPERAVQSGQTTEVLRTDQ